MTTRTPDLKGQGRLKNCIMIDECPFHKGRLARYSASVVESMIRVICRGDQSHCARFKVLTTLGKEHVPDDLSPNDMELARSIIREFHKNFLAQKTPSPK